MTGIPQRTRPGVSLRSTAPLILVLLLAAGLRFHGLADQSFWNDEGNTARLVERPIALIIEGAAGDIHPPGYYLLLHVWRSVTGESEFALRSFSALCGVLTVAVTAAVCRGTTVDVDPSHRVGKWLAAWAAAGSVAVHPLAVTYSQEARMYAQLGLASALTLWAALALVRRGGSTEGGQRPDLATLGLAGSVALGLYTQYAYVLALVGLNLAFGLAWLTRQPWRSRPPGGRLRLLGLWVAAHALGGLLFIPWAPIAVGASGWRPPDLASGEALGALAHTLLAGVTLPEQLPPSLFINVGLLVLLALLISLRARRNATARFAIWAALGTALLPAALIAAAGIYRPAYLKFLMVSVAPLAVVLAAPLQGLVRSRATAPDQTPTDLSLRQSLSQIVVLVLLSGLVLTQARSLQHLYGDAAFRRDDYRGIAGIIREEGRPGDAILLNAPNQWEVFTYYYRAERGDGLPVYPAPYRPTTSEAESWVSDIVEAHQGSRLYVLYWGDLESDPERHIERALAETAFKAGDTWITSVRLARYGTGRAAEAPGTATDVVIGDGIRLTGYDVPVRNWQPGDILPLTLFWQAERVPAEPLKVFVHLVDAGGALVTQTDLEPHAGFLPTTTWQQGETIVDRYGVLLPAAASPGTYMLRIGMYRFSGERLPINVDGVPSGDYLEPIQVAITR